MCVFGLSLVFFSELLSETLRADKQLSALALLNGVRNNAAGIIHTVRARAELAVIGLCQTFSPER